MNDLGTNELKPDLSDRPIKPQKSTITLQSVSLPNVPRKYLMMGVGILILIVLIMMISSGLKGQKSEPTTPQSQNIPLTPVQPSLTNQPIAQPIANQATATSSVENTAQSTQPPPVDMPLAQRTDPSQLVQSDPLSGASILDTPTQPDSTPVVGKNRVEIPGEIVDVLASPTTGDKLSATASAVATVKTPTHKSTVPATQNKTASASHSATKTTTQSTPQTTVKNTTVSSVKGGNSLASLKSQPAKNVTLQLSSASRSESLQAFASKQKLSNYWIYQTQRNGSPWYVLVMGSYPSSAEAEKAVSGLPTAVKQNKPWVKSMRKVHEDIKK